LGLAERLSPSVVWIDDLDTSFRGERSGDGVVGRVLGTFLTWLEERDSFVFLVATMRDPEALPPELLRSGRFDARFFLDWPSAEERAGILRAALARHGRSVDGIPFDKLAEVTSYLSSAELVAGVEEALFAAAAVRRRNPTPGELREALTRVPPEARVA